MEKGALYSKIRKEIDIPNYVWGRIHQSRSFLDEQEGAHD